MGQTNGFGQRRFAPETGIVDSQPGLAVSLGAPFWFDILAKIMNLRGAGPKPARADDS